MDMTVRPLSTVLLKSLGSITTYLIMIILKHLLRPSTPQCNSLWVELLPQRGLAWFLVTTIIYESKTLFLDINSVVCLHILLRFPSRRNTQQTLQTLSL